MGAFDELSLCVMLVCLGDKVCGCGMKEETVWTRGLSSTCVFLMFVHSDKLQHLILHGHVVSKNVVLLCLKEFCF